jgi:hypothetical protein
VASSQTSPAARPIRTTRSSKIWTRGSSLLATYDNSQDEATIPDFLVLRGQAFRGLDMLPRTEAQRLYRGLTRYGQSCGCGAGAIGLLLSLGCYILITAGIPILLSEPPGTKWQPAVIAAVAGAVLGKCAGLWWAYRRFEGLRREFEALFK